MGTCHVHGDVSVIPAVWRTATCQAIVLRELVFCINWNMHRDHAFYSLRLKSLWPFLLIHSQHDLRRRQWHPTPVLLPGKSHGRIYADYIMWNTGLGEAQAGIKTVGRNVNNLRYADDTTLMAESEGELKSFLMKFERGEWKSCLKTQHSEI